MLTAEKAPKANGTAPAPRQMKWEELAEHNHPGSLMVAIRGRVYDVTEFLERHPGTALDTDGDHNVRETYGRPVSRWRERPARRSGSGLHGEL